MNICFVSNFSKTLLYRAIADELKKNDVHVFWIFVDNSLVHYAAGDTFLKLGLSCVQQENECVDDVSINEILYADRYLSLSMNLGHRYLKNIQKPVYDFIRKNRIQYVFGERTWGHELVVSRLVCKRSELDCQYLSFSTVRIPSNRFAFFRDEKDSVVYTVEHNEPYIDFSVSKPDYLEKNNKFLGKELKLLGKVKRVKRFFTKENIVRDNPCQLHSMRLRFLNGFAQEVNRLAYFTLKKSNFHDFKTRKYIFYGLHKQPENSIDVQGMYTSNQYEIILNLWKLLPPDWFLLVKEHSVAIGDRALSFYKNILKLPNVVLIDENTDSYEVIENAQLTCTVTGTVALEAGLMGCNAVTFAKTFFNSLQGVKNVSFFELSEKEFFYRLVSETASQKNIDQYKRYIFSNSFEGCVLDPVTEPTVLSPLNIKKVAKAFRTVLDVD